MTEESTSPTSPQSAPPAAIAKPSDTVEVVKEKPLGYIQTSFLEFVNGVLHQLHSGPHDGQPPVLVPVPGTSTPPGLLADVELMVEQRVQQAEKVFHDKLSAIEARLDTPEPTPPPQPPSS